MEHVMKMIADALEESGRFDNVILDDDGSILIAEDGVLVSLTGTELEQEEG